MSAHGEYVYNWRLQRDQQLWEEQMFDKQTSWDLEQWKRENEYNLPVNLMNRLTAAGINPNLAAQSLVGAGNAAGGLSVTAPQFSPNGAGNGSSLEDYLMQAGQGINQSIQTYLAGEQTKALVKYLESESNKADVEALGMQIDNMYKPALNEANLKFTNEKVTYLLKQGKLFDWQAKQIEEMLPLMKDYTKGQIMELAERVKNLVEERKLIEEKINSEKQLLKESKAREADLRASALEHQAAAENYKASANEHLANADYKNQMAGVDFMNKRRETELKAAEAKLKQQEAEYQKWCHDHGFDPKGSLSSNMVSLFLHLNRKLSNAFTPKQSQGAQTSDELMDALRVVTSDPASGVGSGVGSGVQNVQGSSSKYNPILYGY